MELAEKIESNIVSYLQSILAWPAYFTTDLIHPGESDADKTTQVIQVVCGEAEVEEPAYSRNFWHTVQIELRTPPYLQTDDDKQSSEDAVKTAQLDKHKAVAAVLSDAIVITDLMDQINAAAQDQPDAELKAFAAIGFTDRRPLREQNDNYVMSGFALRLYACAYADAA